MAKYKITSYLTEIYGYRLWQAWTPQGALIETCSSWVAAAFWAKDHYERTKAQGYGGYYSG